MKISEYGRLIFANSKDTIGDIVLPDNVKFINHQAFQECFKLTSIVFPDSITSIGSCAFSNCKNLKNITFSNGLTKIESFTFEYCESLTKIVIPQSIVNIEGYAFGYCTNLSEITIENSKCNIENNAFAGCDKLKWMYINEDESIELCENKKEVIGIYPVEVNFEKDKDKKLSTNYRKNCFNVQKWWKDKKIKFIPPYYTSMIFPSEQMEKYFINDNNKIWGTLVKELGLTVLKNDERDNTLTDLMKIYYSIGGFSENGAERDEAYNCIVNYVNKYFKDATPSKIGEDIHRRFSEINLNGEYNKDFAKFFIANFNKNPDFMNLQIKNIDGELMEKQDYLCSACNSFSKIQEYFPNRVVNGNEERALLTPLFVAEHCGITKYEDINIGNEELAVLIGRYGYNQEQFDRIQKIYEIAKRQRNNYVIKANKANEDDCVTFRILEKDDPLGFVIGNITNCCQHIGGQADSCVEDGYINKNAGFMVFEESDKKTGNKRIMGQAYIWYDEKTKTVCYDNIEIPTKILEELKKKSSKVKIEDLLNAVEKSAESIMKAMNKNGEIKVKRVTTGEGYNDLKKALSEKYERELNPIAHRGEDVYSDAKEAQYIIKTYEKITDVYDKEITKNINESKNILYEMYCKIKNVVIKKA